MNYKKQRIEQHESHWKTGVIAGAPFICSISDTRRDTVNDTDIIWYGNRVRHQYK